MLMNEKNLAVPFFSQRKILYKWQNIQNEDDFFYIASVACNITSLCMLLNYLGITDDTPEQMAENVFKDFKKWNSEPKGYDNLTLWKNIKAIPSRIYGIEPKFIKDLTSCDIKKSIEKYIQNSYPIVFSIGTLSKNGQGTTGHIAVLRGIKKTGYYIINDPWGVPGNQFGLLNSNDSQLRGFYTARAGRPDILFGKGNGDNCILTERTFFKSTGKKTNNGRIFNGAITITYPHIYSFPLGNLKYGVEKDIKEKIYNTYKDNYRFLVADNGLPIRGLWIRKQQGQKIHSVSAGRIVAIRNSRDIKDNFVLIQYRVPGNENKYFYVNYKHLEYIDIDKEIKDRLFSGNKNRQPNDYISQLIEKISPKKGIYDKGTSTGSFNDELNIPERGFAYFYPLDKNLQDFLFDVHIGAGANKKEEFAYDVNDIRNYEIMENGKKFYNVYTSSGIKKISPQNFIPQSINYREFLYYREKLRTLADGEITYFFDTEYKETAAAEDCLNEKNYGKYFFQNVNNIFDNITFRGEEYSKALKNVEDYYIEKINEAKSNNKKAEKIWQEFEDNCKLLCKSLLEIPWENQEWAFDLDSGRFKGDKNEGEFIGVKDIYNSVFNAFKLLNEKQNLKKRKKSVDIENKWENFVKKVSMFYPSSFDDFIEASLFTELGTASSEISIECFSEANLFPDEDLIEVSDIKKGDFLKALHEKKVIDESYLFKTGPKEKSYFLPLTVNRLTNEKIQDYGKTVLLMFNPFAVNYEKKFMEIIKNGTGAIERDEDYKNEVKIKNFFPKEIAQAVKKRFGFNSNREKYYYYNIVEFLDYMDKKSVKAAEGII